MTDKESIERTKQLTEELIELASSMAPGVFKRMLFSSVLGVMSALSDEYFDEMMSLPVSEALGQEMKDAAENFAQAVARCRTAQRKRHQLRSN